MISASFHITISYRVFIWDIFTLICSQSQVIIFMAELSITGKGMHYQYYKNKCLLFYRHIIYFRFFISCRNFENNRSKTVITAANSNIQLFNLISIIKYSASMGNRNNILVHYFQRLIT